MTMLLPAALALLTVSAPALPAGCATPSARADELLSRARVALDLAGTEQVGAGARPGCIAVVVRTPGTARLASLVLRGVGVPAEAIDVELRAQPMPALR